MEPTYKSGDRLFVSRLIYFFREPRIKEIVVLGDPRTGRLILKRIEGASGDDYFVSGDNLEASTDSRAFGPVTKKDILGKVILRYRRVRIK